MSCVRLDRNSSWVCGDGGHSKLQCLGQTVLRPWVATNEVQPQSSTAFVYNTPIAIPNGMVVCVGARALALHSLPRGEGGIPALLWGDG